MGTQIQDKNVYNVQTDKRQDNKMCVDRSKTTIKWTDRSKTIIYTMCRQTKDKTI